jgi:hypothetical protein
MKKILFPIIISLFLSCCTETEKQNDSVEEIGFNALQAIKNNDRQSLYKLFDQDLLANTPESSLDEIVIESKKILDQYPFPKWEDWKKNRLLCKFDTSNLVLTIGVPLSPPAKGSVDHLFNIKFSSSDKITSINISQIPGANYMPDSEFPKKEEKFNYTFDSLISIRLYYLPGNSISPDSSKSIEFKGKELSLKLQQDFESVLATLNSSKINSTTKTTEHLQPTNELKALIFRYRDGVYLDSKQKREKSVFLISNENVENTFEVRNFNVLNATYLYQLSDKDNKALKKQIDTYFKKYIK